MASTTFPVRTLEVPQQNSYPQFRAEDSVFYSRWIYGNNTARLIAWVRNSQLSKAVYTPNGQVQNQGYRVLYGISLTATTVIGLCLDTIQNFLAICSLYYLGKKIWEYRNSQGAFSSNALAIDPASKEGPIGNAQVETSKDLANKSELRFTYDPNRWTSVLFYLHFYPNRSSVTDELTKISDEKGHLFRLLHKPFLPENVKQALYSYLEALPMQKLRIGLSTYLSGNEPNVPIKECIEWIVCLRDALSNISLPEDPLKKLKTELEAEWTKKEQEMLSDLSLDDSTRKSRHEDVHKRYGDIFRLLDTLSTIDYWRPVSPDCIYAVPDDVELDDGNTSTTDFAEEMDVLRKLNTEINEVWNQKETEYLSDFAVLDNAEKRAQYEGEKAKFRFLIDSLAQAFEAPAKRSVQIDL